MKITRIEIAKHLQFKDFELDLTYPKGHAKEGQPLDKVCIIGQNGTGKTTLLNLLSALENKSNDKLLRYEPHFFPEESEFTLSTDISIFQKALNKDVEIRLISPRRSNNSQQGLIVKKILYISADILGHFRYFDKPTKPDKNLVAMNNQEKAKDIQLQKLFSFFDKAKHIKIDENINENLWKYIFRSIDIFEKQVEEKNQELFKKMTTKDAEKVFQEFIQWKKEQKNPRADLAEKLNEMLDFFHLEIDVEEMSAYISLRRKNEESIIPNAYLSTGTKQIILTTALLWGIGLDNSIVLFDEAERSLYPDTQRRIIDFYTKISETSQYFFATHSPIIAASFEPWEIVELVFDDEGNVKPRKYYDEGKERHIDNYFIDFRYLRWDDILQKGFGMTEEGNSEFREKELMQAARLRKKLERMREEGKGQTPEYETFLQEYIKSARKLAWNV